MKKLLKLFCVLFFAINANSQTMLITAMQQLDAKATGYAIIASRNLGKIFPVYVIKGDGVNSLQQNVNNQINSAWHPQAVVKGKMTLHIIEQNKK